MKKRLKTKIVKIGAMRRVGTLKGIPVYTSPMVSDNTVYLIDASTQRAATALENSINDALFGNTKPAAPVSRIKKIYNAICGKLTDFRIALAEYIGGPDLHRNCDY